MCKTVLVHMASIISGSGGGLSLSSHVAGQLMHLATIYYLRNTVDHCILGYCMYCMYEIYATKIMNMF
jgi:hypothetical protein